MNMKPNKLQAAILLSEGKLNKDVAAEVNVTPQTISSWLSEPEFIATVNSLKKELVHTARDKVRAQSVLAAETLMNIMQNSSNDSTRLKAAERVLEIVGLINIESCMWEWGIGSTSAEGVSKELEKQKEKDILGFTL